MPSNSNDIYTQAMARPFGTFDCDCFCRDKKRASRVLSLNCANFTVAQQLALSMFISSLRGARCARACDGNDIKQFSRLVTFAWKRRKGGRSGAPESCDINSRKREAVTFKFLIALISRTLRLFKRINDSPNDSARHSRSNKFLRGNYSFARRPAKS